MAPATASRDIAVLNAELDWLWAALSERFQRYFAAEGAAEGVTVLSPPPLDGTDTEYARLVTEWEMGPAERLALVLALAPHLRPQALDGFLMVNKQSERGYSEFGGWRGKTHGGFLPTGETVLFLLAGADLEARVEAARMFDEDHGFARGDILRVQTAEPGEPSASGVLRVSTDILKRLTSGSRHRPDYGVNFPAKRITTPLEWEDLVLAPEVMEEVEDIRTWLREADTLMGQWGLARVVKPGYRALFYGPPGTGKTLTATLVGADAGVDVYRVDLSMVVSKYIGETEKNLANVFDQAENKNWVLFFDEADALFGRRTQTTNSNDRHANQEVSYLLQRVEDFPGVTVLATNRKANIDEAFARRFQSVTYFPMPDAEQRLALWRGVFEGSDRLADDVNLWALAEGYELSGGAITNVVRYAAIRSVQRGDEQMSQSDLLAGVAKERRKEGKTS